MKGLFECVLLTLVACLSQITGLAVESSSSDVLSRLQGLEDHFSALKLELKQKQDCECTGLQTRSKRATVIATRYRRAFHVTEKRNTLMVIGATIHFGTILTDTNALYDKNTGHFLCDVSGTYLFTITVMAANSEVQAGIVRRPEAARPEVLGTAVSNGVSQGSVTVVVELNTNDLVYVDLLQAPGIVLLEGKGMTSFSGVLLYQRHNSW